MSFQDPPSDDDANVGGQHARHWALDMPDGATVEGLADSLIREAGAIHALEAGPIYVRRGEADGEGEWVDAGDEVRRHRLEADFPSDDGI